MVLLVVQILLLDLCHIRAVGMMWVYVHPARLASYIQRPMDCCINTTHTHRSCVVRTCRLSAGVLMDSEDEASCRGEDTGGASG